MSDNDDDADKLSDEDDIGTMMRKNERKRDYSFDDDDDDSSAASGASNEEPQLSFLETQPDDDSDDDVVYEKSRSPAVTPATKPVLLLDDSSDDEEEEEANQRAKQAMITDPSLLKLQYARLLAQHSSRDQTHILEQQAEAFATQQAAATRRNYFDVQPVWNDPSASLPTLPPVVRIVRTDELTQVHHLTAQLLRQLEFKRVEHYTVALRLDNHLLGEHEHVSKLTKGLLRAVLYHDGFVVKKTAAAPKKKMIRLTVRSPDGKNEHEFQIGEQDPFSELVEQYFQKHQVRVTLHFDGDALRPNQTPKMMEMEDEDLIDSKVV